jgi:hypothetical protein
MIGEVTKALAAYESLNTVGKRLFREELGLVRPQQAKRRKRADPTEAVTKRRPRSRPTDVTVSEQPAA